MLRTSVAVVRRYWRSFLPAWCWPLVLFYGGSLALRNGVITPFLWLVFFPFLVWALVRGSRPGMRKEISVLQTILWVVFFPFVVWAVVVFAVGGLPSPANP